MHDVSSSDGSDGSASTDASSSEGEDEAPEPQVPEVEVKPEPENNKRWNLSEFLPEKSPNDAPLSHEPVEPIKTEEPEDDDIQTPSDHHYNDNSNSSVPEKSDASLEPEDHQMPPPAKVKSPSKTPEDKTPDTDLSSVFSFIKHLHNIQPISSISDSDDNVGSERPPKKKRAKKERARLPKDIDAADSSSDESSRFSESRGRSSVDESKRVRKNSFPVNPYDATNTSSDTNSLNGAKKAKKSPRKESQSRKQSRTNRRRPSISRKTIPSSDGSSDEGKSKPPKPSKAKDPKKMPKKKPKSPEKIATSDDDSENERRPTKHSPFRQSPLVPPHINSSSERSEDSESCGEVENSSKKIEKIVSDKNKNDMVRKLFNVTKVSEGGKGGKGGAKAKGQVVVITPEDAQNQSKSNDSDKFTSAAAVLVRIDLSRIDLDLLSIPPEKLKNVIRTKSPAVPIVEPTPQRKTNKRKRSSNHDEQDRWRKPGFDQLSVSSSSSATSEVMDNPAASRIASSYTTNYTNDRLNNNIAEHKTKDFYHSPSSVDTKLPKIKKEHRGSPLKASTNNFRNTIKQETVKQEEFDGTQMRARASSLTNYKKRKPIPMDGMGENSLPLPPTNHERLPMNGDLMAKPEVVKKVYVSYFERTNDEIEQQEPR